MTREVISTRAIGQRYGVKQSSECRHMLQRLNYLADKPVRKGASTYKILKKDWPDTVSILTSEFIKKFRTTSPSNLFNEAKNDIESLSEELSEWRDSMGENEGLAQTDKYERVEEAADTLENVVGLLDDIGDEIDALDDVEVYANIPYTLPYDIFKGAAATSRSRRTANASSMLDALYGRLETVGSDFDADTLSEIIEALSEAIDELDTIDYPGMYG